MNKGFLVLSLLVLLMSCDSRRIYEDNKKLSNQYWHVDSLAVFEFDVNEVTQPHHLFFNIRNTSAYPYYNIYVQYELVGPGGIALNSGLMDINLFDPKKGAPFGEGLGDVFDHQYQFLTDYEFTQTGNHKLKFQQFMRLDSLPMVHYVGTRVELAK